MQHGDLFFNKSAPGLPSHPWVILSDPEIDPNDVLVVNLTDTANISDDSCELEVEDHPSVITKRSRVAYQYAKITSVAMLEKALRFGLLVPREPMPDAALSKILSGAFDSDELKNAHRLLLRNQGLIDKYT